MNSLSLKFRFGFPLAWALALVLAPAAAPAAEAPLGGRLPVKVHGDRVLARVAMQTELFFKDSYIVIDFARPTALEMHQNLIQSLAFAEGEQNLQILAEGFRIEVPREGVVQEVGQLLGPLTARYANELENIEITAILGWPALRGFSLGMHLAEGELTLAPSQEASAEQAGQRLRTLVQGLRILDGRVYIPVSYAGGKPAYMVFGNAGYHSYIDQATAQRLGKPAGDLDGILFGAADSQEPISGMAALFPVPFEAPPEGLNGDLLLHSGLSLWSAYRLELNPNAGYLALAPVVDSNYSQADFAFYAAAAARDRAALRTYIEGHPADRNVEEAAALLFELGLAADAPVAEQMQAIAYGLAVTPERRKLEYVAGFAGPLFSSERKDAHTALILALCEEAMRHIARSEKPALRQQLQLMMGDRHLAQGDAHQAWKYFLAAAFNGDPRLDGIVRHELGRAYEALGRNRRAYSSYKRALSKFVGLPPELQTSAQAGLERLRPLLNADDPLLRQERDDA